MWETPEILISQNSITEDDLKVYDMSKPCIVIVNFSVACDHIRCC